MSYYQDNDVIRVTARGSMETTFTSATFRAKVMTSGKTGPDAKALALPTIEQIKRVVHEHAERGAIDTNQLKTSFAVDVETSRHTGEFCGYRATYGITFTGRNVGAATAIHDALTTIDRVQASTPVFNVDDSAEVQAGAFHDAVAKAKALFAGQCAALDFNPTDFYVLSWSIDTDRPMGKTLALAASPEVVEVAPGKALLEMTVNFIYARKGTMQSSTKWVKEER